MPVLTRPQVEAYARAAGFSGSSLTVIVAIAGAESGWNTRPKDNINDDPWRSRDRGILQINNHWHPEVSDAQAYDPATSFHYGYVISSHGNDFQPWSTYVSGAYKAWLPGGSSDPGGGGGGNTSGYVFPLPGWHGTIDLHWGTYAGATDLMAPQGTPVVAVHAGRVSSAGSNSLGGNSVFILGSDNLQYYYAHMRDTPLVKSGQTVSAGQALGYVGKTGNADTTDPHLHIGIGHTILTGGGPTGGAGEAGFDAVGMLRQIYNNEPVNTGGGPGPSGGGAPGYVTLYTEPNYGGRSVVIHNDDEGYNLANIPLGLPGSPNWNNRAKSIRVPLGTTVRLYEDVNEGTGTNGIIINASESIADLTVLFPLGLSSVKYVTLGTGGGGGSSGGGIWWSNLTNDVHNTLAATPGFTGIALALDEAEQFPGFVWLVDGSVYDVATNPTGFAGDVFRSLFATLSGNLMALLVRGLCIFFGVVLFISLVMNAVRSQVDVGDLAGLAALA